MRPWSAATLVLVKRRNLLIATAIVLLLAATGWYRFGRGPEVTAAAATRGTAVEIVYATGGVEPVRWAKVASVIRDRIVDICECEGQTKAKGDVLVQCAGVGGEFAIDDAYTAGRYVAELRVWLAEWEATDAAQAAEAIAGAFPSATEGLGVSRSARNLRAADLADDVRYCARESVLDIVPSVGDIDGDVALITA